MVHPGPPLPSWQSRLGAGVAAGLTAPPRSPPAKPKLSAEERRARQEDRLKTIRLRMLIGRELDDRGVTDPVEIGMALGMPTVAASKLLTRNQWRKGDVALLEAVAAKLGVRVPASSEADFLRLGRLWGLKKP